MNDDYVYHHGIKGQKWGVRRFQNNDGSLTPAGKHRYYVENNPNVTFENNNDGSFTIPVGFKFNRVGKASLDINKSGVLYMSYGKEDAARYVKSLGPTLVTKLMGNAGEAVQHIECVSPMNMASTRQVEIGLVEIVANNKRIFDKLNEDGLATVMVTADFNKKIDRQMINYALENPGSNAARRLAQATSFWLGDGRYAEEAKMVYKYFTDKGYDAIPDITDRDGGASKTAMIVMNTNKVQITSTTKITRDIMKEAKAFVATLSEIEVDDIYDDL